MCRRAGCGQCVSEEHQGIFHSVNLLDTVFQEEKLTFFSSLKKMRIINEKLMNEVSSHPNDTDMVVNSEADIIALEFGEIFRTLEMKKQQLIEDLENQRSKKEKEFQIWKKMKETHKKTIENFLKDCEKLVHECDPQRFLEVACGLNARMKTQLDLMSIASSYEKPPEYTQKKMDIKPVVNEILALKLVPVNVDMAKDLPSGGNQNSTKNTIKQWQDQKNMPKMFIPVAGQEEALTDGGRICTRLMSISEMSAFQNMSHEELRYKYYMERQKLADEFKTQTLPANKKHKFVAAEALKDKSSGIPSVSLPTTANNTNGVNMGILQKEERDCSAVSGVSNSSKILPLSSFSNQSEKPADQNTLSHMVENAFSPKKTVENDTLKPSVSVEQKANASESITTAPCSTSETGIAAGVDDVSESSLLPSTCVFSFKNNCFQLPSPVFSFGSIVKNTTDSLTSSSIFLSSNGTEKSEQEKMKPVDKTPPNLVKSASPECTETASRHSHPKDEGSFPMGSSKKIESAEILADSNSSCSPLLCSAVLPAKDENASSDHLTITSTQQEVKVKDQGSIAENNCSIPGREDELKSRMLQNAACSAPGMCNDSVSRASVLTVNESGGMLSDSDSDTEALSQTSVSSDTSSVSEYFSVAEDKIPTRRKSEA
nr:serine-rich adhesin for platelets isoform X3 [Anas platyrhynchos]|eukprot:XP_027312239.1 uncharacterized protein LOC101789404 isoform X4 [Anas platyrhynchos]